MHRALIERLLRQWKALIVLERLQQEEFSLLSSRKPQAVAGLEFSIHELMRQIVAERQELKTMLNGQRIRAMLDELPPDLEARILMPDYDRIKGLPEFHADITLRALYDKVLQLVDKAEQACAKQAERNSALALGLYDQSQSILEFMHKEIQPKKVDVYGRKGAMQNARGEAALIQGRL